MKITNKPAYKTKQQAEMRIKNDTRQLQLTQNITNKNLKRLNDDAVKA
jgi:hypothetical protein